MQIVFDKVNYTYISIDKKNSHALRDICLDLTDSTLTAIVGHTGSGKSTAMQHINGLLQPQSGSIWLNGNEITSKKYKKWSNIRQKIGYVFQNPAYQLFANSVLEDAMYGPLNYGYTEADAKLSAIEALEIMGVDSSLYQRYPFELSGGQMKRVAIAGILAYNPEILILDEPTVGLDPLAIEQMINLFETLAKEHHKKLIFITHDMEFVQRIAERVIIFSDGEVVGDMNPHDLFTDEEFMKTYSLEAPFMYQLASEIKAKLPTFSPQKSDYTSIDSMCLVIKKWKE